MELPKGCNKSCQISYISDEALRPHPESVWLFAGIKESGERVTGVSRTLEEALENLRQVLR